MSLELTIIIIIIIIMIIVENFICIFVIICTDHYLAIQRLITYHPSCKTTTAVIITSIVKCVKVQIAVATQIILVVVGAVTD